MEVEVPSLTGYPASAAISIPNGTEAFINIPKMMQTVQTSAKINKVFPK